MTNWLNKFAAGEGMTGPVDPVQGPGTTPTKIEEKASIDLKVNKLAQELGSTPADKIGDLSEAQLEQLTVIIESDSEMIPDSVTLTLKDKEKDFDLNEIVFEFPEVKVDFHGPKANVDLTDFTIRDLYTKLYDAVFDSAESSELDSGWWADDRDDDRDER